MSLGMGPREAERQRRREDRRRSATLITLAGLTAGGIFVYGGQEGGVPRFAAGLMPNSTPAESMLAPLPTPVQASRIRELPVKPTASPVVRADALGSAVSAPEASESFARLRQLTFDGCCAGAWWAADSQALHYIDRPASTGQSGIYAVPLWPPGALPAMLDTRLAMETEGSRFLVRPEVGYSVVRDVSSGLEWPLPTEGNPVRLSHDGSRAVWWEAPGGREQIDALNRVFSSSISGEDAREIGALWGASVIAFLPDNRHVIVSGRPEQGRPDYILARLDTIEGRMDELVRGRWLGQVSVSPDGAWLAYMISLDRDRPEANGIWVAPTAPGLAEARKLEAYGAYRWRDASRLVYVPMMPGAAQHTLIEFDVHRGGSSLLFDPTLMPIRIASNDWTIAPDGKTMAFVSADDGNIWVLALPD